MYHRQKSLFDYKKNIQTSSYVDRSISSFSHEGFPDIPSVKLVNPNVFKRLEENWEYTAYKHENDRHERIRHFINLCKKEGRGELLRQTSLFKVFTDQLAKQIEKELLDYYGI